MTARSRNEKVFISALAAIAVASYLLIAAIGNTDIYSLARVLTGKNIYFCKYTSSQYKIYLCPLWQRSCIQGLSNTFIPRTNKKWRFFNNHRYENDAFFAEFR